MEGGMPPIRRVPLGMETSGITLFNSDDTLSGVRTALKYDGRCKGYIRRQNLTMKAQALMFLEQAKDPANFRVYNFSSYDAMSLDLMGEKHKLLTNRLLEILRGSLQRTTPGACEENTCCHARSAS